MAEFKTMSSADVNLPEVNSSDFAAVMHHKKMMDVLNLLLTRDTSQNESKYTQKLRDMLERDTKHHYELFEARCL